MHGGLEISPVTCCVLDSELHKTRGFHIRVLTAHVSRALGVQAKSVFPRGLGKGASLRGGEAPRFSDPPTVSLHPRVAGPCRHSMGRKRSQLLTSPC